MKKIIALCTSVISMLTLAVVPAFAHVIVSPRQVGVAAVQDFIVSVPNEKDNSVVSARLLVPSGMRSIVPNTVPGWTITTQLNGSGDDAVVKEIDWSGGSIPVGQRAEFVFQAQVPSKQTTLAWKAYQTYSDGTVVSWDINPEKMKNMSDVQQDKMADQENKGEYSTTQVVNDLTDSSSGKPVTNANLETEMMWLLFISGGAFILSIVAIGMQLIKQKK